MIYFIQCVNDQMTGLMVMTCCFACFQLVLGAAIRAAGMAGFGHIQKHPWVRAPQGNFFGWAVKRQVFCTYFNFPCDGSNSFICHVVYLLLNECEPVCMLGRLAFYNIKIHGLQLFRHRATFAFADCTVVQFADRSDFGSSTGEERFIR